MASAGARVYNGGLRAEPWAGSRGRTPGQGVRGAKPPWSWKHFNTEEGKFGTLFQSNASNLEQSTPV